MSYLRPSRLSFLTRVLPGIAIAGFFALLLCEGRDPERGVAAAEALEAESIARCGADPVCRLAYGASARVGADLDDDPVRHERR